MIKIPNTLNSILDTNYKLKGFISTSLDNLNPWISDNKLPFFPDYTDHGHQHIAQVVDSACKIITPDSLELITPEDTAAIIISAVLHDCAMHISEDGFFSLINGNYKPISSKYIQQEEDWSEAWTSYLAEAKRFDGKTLISIFGDAKPIASIPNCKLDLTMRDRLLIGEFLRRNHARLAHEIALNGIPGPTSDNIILGTLDNELLDLFGFISRSHNLGLREATDRLEKNKRRLHLNTHTPYIMAVLRIADYLQIHSSRASQTLLKYKSLSSPISEKEWKKHHAVIEITQTHDDPDAWFIDAEPEDAITFTQLRRLFSDIQSELDSAWSVLGEIYGRIDNLKNLGITIRRIKSSIDDIDEFVLSKKPKYIPKVLNFNTADTELLELLITPLYGDRPEIGIRELTQNSVDACIELRDILKNKNISTNEEYQPKIHIELQEFSDGSGKLTVSDNGVGMTLNVIENYFLNIGASYRRSDLWKKDHEIDGKSKVHRTGRFGIGLLAAYLLGNKIVVTTSPHTKSAPQGYKFECERTGTPITINKINREYGTTISIETNKSITQHLKDNKDSWDWFTLATPATTRSITFKDGKTEHLEQKKTTPDCLQSLEGTPWNRISSDDFDDVIWTYANQKKSYSFSDREKVYCNGIFITDDTWRLDEIIISPESPSIGVSYPTLAIFDSQGAMPINLERDQLTTKTLPFHKELENSIAQFAAHSLKCHISETEATITKDNILHLMSTKPFLRRYWHYNQQGTPSYYISKKNKIIPLDRHLFYTHRPSELYIDAADMTAGSGAWNSKLFGEIATNYLCTPNIGSGKTKRAAWIRSYFLEDSDTWFLSSIPKTGLRLVILKRGVSDIIGKGYLPASKWVNIKTEWENSLWQCLVIGTPPSLDVDLQAICNDLSESASLGFIIQYYDWNKIDSKSIPETPFGNAWNTINSNL